MKNPFDVNVTIGSDGKFRFSDKGPRYVMSSGGRVVDMNTPKYFDAGAIAPMAGIGSGGLSVGGILDLFNKKEGNTKDKLMGLGNMATGTLNAVGSTSSSPMGSSTSELAGLAGGIGGAAMSVMQNPTPVGIAMGALKLGSAAFGYMGAKAERKRMEAHSESVDFAEQQELENQRQLMRNQAIGDVAYMKDGGMVTGDGKFVNNTDLTGENIYPLSKSMENNEDVIEVELGEYLKDETGAVFRAAGEPHKDGGTRISVPGSMLIVSQKRKMPDYQIKELTGRYNLKVGKNPSYADVIDKFKSSIGLSKLYDEKESLLKRVEKNNSIDDENTKRLNESYLSGRLSELDDKMGPLETQMSTFFNDIYAMQESEKDREFETDMFGEGGIKKSDMFKSLVDKYKVSPDEVASSAVRQLRQAKEEKDRYKEKFADGGAIRKYAEAGRKYEFHVMDNPYRNFDDIEFQSKNNMGTYGGASPDVVGFMQKQWGSAMGDLTFDGSSQSADVINKTATGVYTSALNLGKSGIISNYDNFSKAVQKNMFNPQSGDSMSPTSLEEFKGTDSKLGMMHATTPFIQGNILSAEEYKRMEDMGISNYRDLIGNQEALKSFDQSRRDELMAFGANDENLNFRLGAYRDEGSSDVPSVGSNNQPSSSPDTRSSFGPNVAPPVDLSGLDEVNKDMNDLKQVDVPKDRRNPFGGIGLHGPYIPSQFRLPPSALTTPSLKSHTYMPINPYMENKEAYLTEVSRQAAAQLNQLKDIPENQRGAIMATIQAAADTDYAKYASGVDSRNAERYNQAAMFNAQQFMQTSDKNIEEARAYETSVAKGQAILEQNRRTYYDQLQTDRNAIANVRNTYNVLSSTFPNVKMLPNGQFVYDSQGARVAGQPMNPYYAQTVNEQNREFAEATRGRRATQPGLTD